MKAIHIIAIIAIAFVAGMFGGAFSERVFANPKADEKIPEQITARGFNLVDENNKSRASMGFSADGQPIFCVADSSGKARGYLGCGPDGPTLALLDKQGRVSINIAADNSGGSTIAMVAEGDKPRLGINYKPGRGPVVGLFDENSVGKAVMAVTKEKAYIGLAQNKQNPAITLISEPGKGAMLAAWNSQGQHRLSLGLMHDKPILFAYNPDDTGLLFNTQRDGRPALGLLSEGSVVWSASGVAPEMPAMDGILDQIMR
ncbi:MAG: hypothetical protein KKE29_01075 [Proteobacteria bacterium]|nr:hypothetical protein [Pseudomonadota bacterium]MBU4575345.1 hypothetical protein [Pseudomonadota bacterium]MBU4597896.1 hypothetical protein [Pseudomonadota bacterium]MBV1715281.1 hypothetical protein [Desulfarculus sp.]MBV1751663.1 hypothetical protein [Desulfarculus sp.]